MHAFLNKLEKSFDFWFLVTTSFLFFLLRLPSFFEPYWYGDEGVYEVLGFGIRHGRLLYQGVWDNKPPLLYLIYAAFDGNQPFVRFFSFVVGLFAIYFFFALAKKLFTQKKHVFIVTGIFTLLFGLPLLEGNIANAENFMILPATASMYFLVKIVREKTYNLLILFSAGLLLGISFLIKVVAVFDFATAFLFVGFASFAWNGKSLRKLLTHLILISTGFFLPLILTLLFFASQHMLSTFIQSAFLTNVGYVNFGNQFVVPFTHIIIPQGFLLIKLFLLLVFLSILCIKRKSVTLTQLFLYIWLPFSLFNAFFSQRPYTHYLLVLLPSLVLFIGLFLEKKWRILHVGVFTGMVILLATNFWIYGKTVFYYQNFVQMLTGQKTVKSYQTFFDNGVPRDYAIADFLKKNTSDRQRAFLWTNSPQVYYLMGQLPLGRYTTAYHITATPATLQETASVLAKIQPKFIVVFPNASSFPFPMTDYTLKMVIDNGLIYERIF